VKNGDPAADKSVASATEDRDDATKARHNEGGKPKAASAKPQASEAPRVPALDSALASKRREDALNRYLVHEWGGGYFSIDEDGTTVVRPDRSSASWVRLSDVVDELKRRGFRSPFLLRFPQLLKDRVLRLNEAFNAAIKEFDYGARYQGVLPVKVNQQRVVVEAIAEESPKHRYGVEVGSKGELALALTLTLHPEAFVICNGFKDRDYCELALRAAVAGLKVVLIAETIHEVQEIVGIAKDVGVRPILGFRARLHSSGVGRWEESGGSHAKFGLSTGELIEAIQFLRDAGSLDCLNVLHFHIGSQLCDIRATKEAVKEATRLYCHLKRRAPSLTVLDVGGGLAVDYDGTRTASDWSHNYTLEEYCRDVVYNVKTICDQEETPPPILCSESGRAILAYHAVHVVTPLKIIGRVKTDPPPVSQDASHQVLELRSTLDELRKNNCRELINDAKALYDELILGFKLGFVTLEDRAAGEALYHDICRKALKIWDRDDASQEELLKLEETTAPRFVCNFSIFQSLPDTWAMRQVFPVVPLLRNLDEPVVQATFGDITCDSDGRIDDFVGCDGLRKTLPLPTLDVDEPFPIGIFLVGAYQDTLGDFHNLFGQANEAAVVIDGAGSFSIAHQYRGTTVAEAMEEFGYPLQHIRSSFDERFGVDETVDSVRFRDAFMRVVSSGTYLKR
jgi:arginine decarboxylase